MRLEWERSEEENNKQMKENARREEDLRLRAKEQELKQQEVINEYSLKQLLVAKGEL